MKIDEFLRLYSLRAPNLMWFLGAGASSSARIPTAEDMIWRFKRLIYCTTHKIPIETCNNLSDLVLRNRLQIFFDNTGNYPALNSKDEYSCYFESAFPSEKDRRLYLDQLMKDATPSYGHLILASLLKLDKARIIWTTNFDRLIEDAVFKIYERTGDLVIATLDTSNLASQALAENRWPLLIKLHGDFHSRRLKNIPDELKKQDNNLRSDLFKAGSNFGMVVTGYSGRDDSVMEIFNRIVKNGGFPNGLFWFQPSTSPISHQVSDLILDAKSKEIEAHIVECETFDELLGDLINLAKELPSYIQKHINIEKPKVLDVPLAKPGNSWPLLRLNGFFIPSFPEVCRLIECEIGGIKEVKKAISESGVNVLASRRKAGVIAFGSDSDLRKAFNKYNIKKFDIYSIERKRLYYDSSEYSLLYSAFCYAISRQRPLKIRRRRGSYLALIDSEKENNVLFKHLRKAVGALSGIIPRTELRWCEAVNVKLEYRLDNLWLLIQPTILVEFVEEENNFNTGKEFVRDRLTRRYNREWNEIIDAWGEIFTGGERECEISAFGISGGIDAVFEITKITAYSRKQSC